MEGPHERRTGEPCRDGGEEELTPQSRVVAVQAGAQRPARHEQLGAGVVVAVSVHGVGEGVDVGEVTPPRLVVILKAATREEKEEK